MPAKKKKEPEPIKEPSEELVQVVDLEEPVEEVQWTDTSYTSASLESLPLIIEEPRPKPKRRKKSEVAEVLEVKEDIFVWSEDSLPFVEEEEKKVGEEEKRVEKKKAKKGKKGKEPKEEIPDFEKPKEWKKMNSKQREQWLVQRIEEWRMEVAAAKQAALAVAKENRIKAAKERQELLTRNVDEQDYRRYTLQKICNLFAKADRQKIEYDNNKQMKEEWAQYLKCDGLPDPRVVTQMATYLHLWKELNIDTPEELEKRCVEALPMLAMLEEICANPRIYTERQARNYNEVRIQLRQQLSYAIELASYSLIKDIERNLTMESVRLATYERTFTGLKLTLWCSIKMPTRKLKPVEPAPEPTELEFPGLKVEVVLPSMINASLICVRASRSAIDLLSESSRSFHMAGEVPRLYEDLYNFMAEELIEVQKLKIEQDQVRSAFFKTIRERTKELEALIKTNPYAPWEKEKEELDDLNLREPPPMPDPRTAIGEDNERKFRKFLKSCMTRTRTGEVHLRKYRICGGVLNMDLLIIPPQPKRMSFKLVISTFMLPKQVRYYDYKVQYRAPGPPEPGVIRSPEEIEAEMKKIQQEFKKLALVTIELPKTVMFTEPPVICQWQEQRKLWTTNYVNDYKYNEEKGTIQFRTGVLWPIGIATLRYSNMPYVTWDMRPDPEGGKGVEIIVTGVCVTITFLCVNNAVKIRSFANAPNNALRPHVNKKYSVKRLTQIMREAACDFFPEFDGHNHVEGSCPKEWPMERHLYMCMAYMSRAYNFQWSRWNSTAGYRTIVIQIREAVDKKREGKFQLLYVDPERAYLLKCNELSPELDTQEKAPGMDQFYPDLFSLNMSYGSVDARRFTFNMQYKLFGVVFSLLLELKLCSFS